MAILASIKKCEDAELDNFLIAGELSLSGKTRPVKGTLAMAMLAKKLGKRALIVPAESADEAALVEGVAIYPVGSLDEAVRFLNHEHIIKPLPTG